MLKGIFGYQFVEVIIVIVFGVVVICLVVDGVVFVVVVVLGVVVVFVFLSVVVKPFDDVVKGVGSIDCIVFVTTTGFSGSIGKHCQYLRSKCIYKLYTLKQNNYDS